MSQLQASQRALVLKSAAQPPALAEDLLPGVAKIAEYTGETERRIRHLIARHNLPHFKRGAIIYSRRSWLDRYYSRSPAGLEAA